MNKPIILSVATALLVSAAIVLSAESASEARADFSPTDVLSVDAMTTVSIAKSDRLAIDEGDAATWDEASNEWTLDCYDQFGPEGWAPDESGLKTCLSSAS